MSRVIKFRAWDIGEKEMVSNLFERAIVNRQGNLIAQSVMQFTGLHDKNEKEIYEGDVVSSYTCKGGVVCFGEYSAGGQDYYASPAYGFYVRRSESVDDTETLGTCKVIGNIYENPELLTP